MLAHVFFRFSLQAYLAFFSLVSGLASGATNLVLINSLMLHTPILFFKQRPNYKQHIIKNTSWTVDFTVRPLDTRP